MPSQDNSSSASNSASQQIPAIRSFQLDGSSNGNLRSSVNLFRGDVNYSQSLFSLPGRRSALDVSVSLMCQSNVHQQASQWNRDQPTGVVGLGWALPSDAIVMNDSGSPSAATRQYSYQGNGGQNQLIRELENPYCFGMDAALAAQLQSGQPVPAAVRECFLALGQILDPTTLVLAIDAGDGDSWQLSDRVNQLLFELRLLPEELAVYDGGESYQLQNYAFWRILYYPEFERWQITKESGVTFSYGGQSSAGNSIAWGVGWVKAGSTVGRWLGESRLTHQDGERLQQQYASAWYLTEIGDPWGDRVRYEYLTVEQLVGSDQGLPYTKAIYLQRIVDGFGRRATFIYGEKVFDSSSPEAPKEYSDPHRAIPNDQPNAYQDRYETRFLDRIEVEHPSGAPILTVQLDYAPRPGIAGPARALANVTTLEGQAYGESYKRYLTGIRLLNPGGDAQPGYLFSYYLDTGETDANLGALQRITYPQGGHATYYYQRQELPICRRELTIKRPEQVQEGATPRLWFGDDYAVSTWYDASAGRLTLQTFTWLGRWQSWQLSEDPTLFEASDGLDLGSLEVIARDDFFALRFDRTVGTSTFADVYLMQKNTGAPGQWQPAPDGVNGQPTGLNNPSFEIATGRTQMSLSGGSTFLLVATSNTIDGLYGLESYTFRWPTRRFEHQVLVTDSQQILYPSAGSEYIFWIAYDYASSSNRQANLEVLDSTLTWRRSTPLGLSGFNIPNLQDLVLVGGQTLVACSRLLQANTSQAVDYQLTVFQWDAANVLEQSFDQRFVDPVMNGSEPTSWTPAVVANGQICVAGNLLRFNGARWLVNSDLVIATPTAQSNQLYAYGPDYAVQVYQVSGGVSARVLPYDPDSDIDSWSTAPIAPVQQPVQRSFEPATANWPSAGGGDWLTIGSAIYYRGTSTDWLAPLGAAPTAQIAGTLDSAAMIDEAPSFLAYYLYDLSDPNDDHCAAITLANGDAHAPQQLLDQRMWTGAEGGDGGSGKGPAGSNAFVTYPASDGSFDNASQLDLYAYAGDEIEGPIAAWPVVGLDIDDGYGQVTRTTIVADLDSAACDPSGEVVKFFTSTVYPGTADPATPRYGWVEQIYLNGLDIVVDNYYDMLDGLLDSTSLFDNRGQLVQQTRNTWEVFIERASEPLDGAAPVLPLHGGYVLQTGQIQTKNGVRSVTRNGYVSEGFGAPYSGQIVSSSSDNVGGDGIPETLTTITDYAYQVNQAMRVLHALQPQAQTRTLWQPQGGAAVVNQATASVYRSWPAATGVEVPGLEAKFGYASGAFADFPFGTYQPGEEPAGWLCSQRILGRSPLGLLTETVDANGVPSSTLFDNQQRFPVARFSNTRLSANQATYLGFEAYETTDPWTLDGTEPRLGDARVGTISRVLPGAGTASLAVTLTPPLASPDGTAQTYVLGFWAKTAADFQPQPGSGWRAVATIDGVDGEARTLDFVDTAGEWRYASLGIPLAVASSSLSLEVTAGNASGAEVLLDGIYLGPLEGGVRARTYHPDLELVTSVSDSAGRATQLLYDSFHRLMASIGADGQVQELVGRFLSRRGNAEDLFDPVDPNAELTLKAADGGIAETFLDGDAWQRRWSASNLSTHWQRADGALVHTTSTSDTLAWLGEVSDDLAVAFELFLDDPPQGEIALQFGDGCRIGWDADGGQWQLLDAAGTQLQGPLGSPPAMASHWTLAIKARSLMFWGDGQLLFSLTDWAAGAASPTLISGPNMLAIRNLAVLRTPRISVSYLDAAGNQRQGQAFLGGDAQVIQSVTDPLGRQLAITKAAPASFGSGASQPNLRYREGFVDVPAFLASLDTTWEMHGDVADYWRGGGEAPFVRSDDQGYPYTGTRYIDAPLGRGVEAGAAGKPTSIHDVSTTSEAQRATTQFAFGATDDGDFYSQTTTTSLKSVATVDGSIAGDTVGAGMVDSSGLPLAQTHACRTYSGDPASFVGQTFRLQLPNSFTSAPQQDPAGYVGEVLQDPLQRTTERSDPDSGTTLYLYDRGGALRFTRPQLDPQLPPYFLYAKYDALGRTLEQGTVEQAWDAILLADKAANDPSWPGVDSQPAVPFTVVRRNTYDGDGDEPEAIGMLEATLSCNHPAPGDSTEPMTMVEVSETYTYDRGGQTRSVYSATNTGEPTTVSYSYNNLGEVTRVVYPAGSPLGQAVYHYDDQGRVVAISEHDDGSTPLLRYTYSPDGQVWLESQGDQLQTAYGYASPGWLASIETTKVGASSPCFSLGYSYNADATPRQQSATMAFGDGEDGQQLTDYTFDGLRRLRSVSTQDGADDTSFPLYDANCNLWKIKQNGGTVELVCEPGSDRLQSVQVGGRPAVAAAYDAVGRMTTVPAAAGDGGSSQVTYDPGLGLPSRIVPASDAEEVRLIYGGHGQRVSKTVDGELRSSYLHGLSSRPLVRIDSGVATAFVYGPTGLGAFVRDQLYFPIKDATGSPRLVLTAGGDLVARYDYHAFGAELLASGPDPGVLWYRFGGQELDPETGFYNYTARLYDPFLRRFHTPDPARQFSSPYVYAGDDPLSMVDPSGQISVWAQVGIGAAMVGVMAVGFLLTPATGGASDAAAVSAEAALAGVEVAAEATVAVAEVSAAAGEAAAGAGEVAAGAAAGAGEAAASGGAEAAAATGEAAAAAASESTAAVGEAAGEAGAAAAGESGAASSAASSLAQNATYVGKMVGGSALWSAGSSGLKYDIQHGRDFTAKGFAAAVGLGAITGAVSGGVKGMLTMPVSMASVSERFGLGKAGVAVYKVLASGVAGAVSSDVSTVLTNYAQGNSLSSGLLSSTVSGFTSSASSNMTSQAFSAVAGTAKVSSVVDKLKQLATSQDAYMVYMTTGSLLVGGYAIWGAAEYSD